MTNTTNTPAAAPEFDCFSINDEDWHTGGLAEVLERMAEDDVPLLGRKYWVGAMVHPKPSDFFSVDTLVDQMKDGACDDHGEYADDFLSEITKEKWSELQVMVDTWLDANARVDFWNVAGITEVVVSEQDIKDCGHE